jgi:hypothetical protein
MRVMWFTNVPLLEAATSTSGSWLSPLARALVHSGQVSICNVTRGAERSLAHSEQEGLEEWLLPSVGHAYRRTQSVPESLIAQINEIVGRFQPDLIHIWGTEDF